MYQQIVEGAFDTAENVWDMVSPAGPNGPHDIEIGWSSGQLAVLCHSQEDILVSPDQTAAMQSVLTRWAIGRRSKCRPRRVEVVSVKGAHDDIWRNGEELAKVISFALENLRVMDGA